MVINYDSIIEANKLIQTTDVKGKEYAEVKERVKAFRYLFPDGTIQTEIITANKEEIVIKASAYNEKERLLSTGYARGKANMWFSLEDTETSAVGRCLGFMGLGITTSIASAEEVQEAQPEVIFDDTPSLKALADEFRKLYSNEDQARILNGLHLLKAEDIGAEDLQKYINYKKYGK